jgi:hypothetical protein
MANQYEALLSTIVSQPDAQLSFFRNMLAEHEKEQRAAEHQEFEQLSLDKLKGRRRAGVKIQAAPASADSKH